MLAGLAGVLLGTQSGFALPQFTFLVLGCFAAVVIARMHSLAAGVLRVAGPRRGAGAVQVGGGRELPRQLLRPAERVDPGAAADHPVRGDARLPPRLPGARTGAGRAPTAEPRRPRWSRSRFDGSRGVVAAAAARRGARGRGRRGAAPVERVVGGDRRQGPGLRDHLPLVHPRDRRRRHDLALPDHASRASPRRSPPTWPRTTASRSSSRSRWPRWSSCRSASSPRSRACGSATSTSRSPRSRSPC